MLFIDRWASFSLSSCKYDRYRHSHSNSPDHVHSWTFIFSACWWSSRLTGGVMFTTASKGKSCGRGGCGVSMFFKECCGWSTGCGEGEVVCAEFGGKEECSTRQRDGGGWVCWPCDFVWWSVWGRSIHDTKEYFSGGSRPVFVCLHINTLNCSTGRRDQTQHPQRAGWERIRGAKILV